MKSVRLMPVAAVVLVPLVLSGHGKAAEAFSSGDSNCMPFVEAAPPPVGFDPMHASTAELRCYGFPTRPTDAGRLRHWQSNMAHATHYVYPYSAINESVKEGVPYATYSGGNWSGYHARANQNTQWPYTKWYEVDADVVVRTAPSHSSGSCVGKIFGQWVGLGGDTSGNNLSQIGVEEKVGSPAAYRAWWQVSAIQVPVTVTEVGVSPGNTVSLQAHYNIGQQSTSFFIQNVTTGTYTSFTKGAGDPTQDADFELEEPLSVPYGPFVYFTNMPFTYMSILGQWGSSGQYLLSKSLNQVNYMTDWLADVNNHKVVSPNSYGSEASGFDEVANAAYATC